MPIDHDIPFFENTPDNTHCFQAALKMGLKFFWPEKEFSWEELEIMTAKKEGLYTWQFAGLLWLKRNGFEAINVEDFDNERFIEIGGKYLIERLGEEVGRKQIEKSDIAQEVKLTKEFIKEIKIINKIPTGDDIKKLLKDKFFIICNVNARILKNREGYSGHFTVVKGYNEDGFIIHDPGLPGIKNQRISFELFEKAWAYPVENAKNIIAFKLHN